MDCNLKTVVLNVFKFQHHCSIFWPYFWTKRCFTAKTNAVALDIGKQFSYKAS